MWKMLQQKKPDDYVISTGKAYTVKEFVQKAFEYAKLDWKKYVKIDKKLFRIIEVDVLQGDSSKAQKKLNWKPKTTFDDLVRIMMEADLKI